MIACTIAIPVYNRAELIRTALESALAQDAPDLEILVIDNASTDETWDALQSYQDPRLRLVRNDANIGLAGNLNRCLELAQGKYLRILCSDDRLIPGCIAGEVELMEQNPNVSLLVTLGWLINAEGKRIGPIGNYLKPGLYPGKAMPAAALWVLSHYGHSVFSYPSGVLMTREATRKAGGFETQFTQCSDVHYFLKVLQHGEMAVTSQEGCEIMIHAGAISNQLMETGLYGSEWIPLAQQWEAYLPSRRLRRQIICQSAAFAVYFALQCRQSGRLLMSRAYLKAAREAGISLWEWPATLGKFCALRLPDIYRQYRIRPIAPMRMLDDRPISSTSSARQDNAQVGESQVQRVQPNEVQVEEATL